MDPSECGLPAAPVLTEIGPEGGGGGGSMFTHNTSAPGAGGPLECRRVWWAEGGRQLQVPAFTACHILLL